MNTHDELDDLLRAARRGFQPRLEDQQRLRRALTVKLATSAGVLGMTGIAWGSVTAKAVSALVVLSVAAGAWYRYAEPDADGSGALTPRARPAEFVQPATRPTASLARDDASSPRQSLVPLNQGPREKSSTFIQPATSLLGEETALLLKARSALRAGNPGNVLTLLSSYEVSFPKGALRQEVQATRVLALCDLGRTDEAVGRAKSFMRSWPNSPMAGRLSTSCVARRLKEGE